MSPRTLLFAALLVMGCGAKFDPETLVDTLRVLAVTAEPPEVAPGQGAAMSALVADPTRSAPQRTTLWVGCEPDPQDLGRSACNDATILLKPTTITDYPPGLKLLSIGNAATYASTPTVFDVLPPDSSIRQTGSVGQVISLVVGEEVDPAATGDKLRGYFERIQDHETQAVIALTRVLVSEKAPEARNHNPGFNELEVDGVLQPTNARLALLPGAQVSLSVNAEGSRETYDELLASGPVTKTETVVGAWYSSSGRFNQERFDVSTDGPTTFITPGSTQFPEDPVPERRSGLIWLVLRDNRGGQSFDSYPFFVCDSSLPTPTLESVTVTGTSPQRLVVKGSHVDALLDVIVGGAALTTTSVDTTQGTFSGDLPKLASGTYTLSGRGKNCSPVASTLTYTVP